MPLDLLDLASGAFGPFDVSPDGSMLAYEEEGDEGSIVVVELDGPSEHVLPGTEGGGIPLFAPDGESIFFAGGDGAIRQVSLDGGAPTTVLTGTLVVAGNLLAGLLHAAVDPRVRK